MRVFLIGMLSFVSLLSVAQRNWCDTDRRFNLSTDDLRYKQFLSLVHQREDLPEFKVRTTSYFPVVIHVVAQTDSQPVSQAQVLNQLDVLNEDFAGKGNNIDKLLTEFTSLVSDVEMRFCLATIDPQGQPTSGITFTKTDVNDIALQTGEGGRIAIHYDQLGGKTGWDPARYINIWVGEYGSILGSASFPGMASYPEEIGLIISIQNFGSIGYAGDAGWYGRGHTLTHEMGHFFGLKHIWGQGSSLSCADGDDIEDTPNAEGPYYDCPSGQQVSCGTSDMYQNFMDLTDDRCLAAFTAGQAIRMQAAKDEYYSGLAIEGGCGTYSDTFMKWYDQLQWADDVHSRKYIIYNQERWMGIKNVRVYSADGRIILEDTWDEELSYLLDLNTVSTGVYFVSISDFDTYFVRKISVYY